MSFLDKIAQAEHLLEQATSPQERQIAFLRKKRAIDSLHEAYAETPQEYTYTFDNVWLTTLFTGLCRKYGCIPFRNPKQKKTTVNLRVPPSFIDKILWPQMVRCEKELNSTLQTTIDHLVGEVGESQQEKEFPSL